MIKKTTSSQTELRRQAEAQLKKSKKGKTSALKTKADALSRTETGTTSRLVHELEVHQIELEMQNGELLRMRGEMQAVLDQYTDLYDFAPVGYFTLARDGIIQQANLTGAALLGTERGKLIKRRFGLLISPASRPAFTAFLDKVFSTKGEKDTCEIELLKGKTEIFWAQIEAVRDAARDTCRVVLVDITARKQAEEALRAREESYRLLADNVPDIIYSLDGAGNIVAVNDSAFERYGYTAQDAKGKPFLNFIHPEDREIVINSFLKALEEQRKFTRGLQFRIVAKNCVNYWFELNSQARFDRHGGYAGEDGVLRDITERRQAEDALRASKSVIKTYLDTMPGVVFMKDLEGRYLLINREYEKLMHIRGEDVIGKTAWDLFPKSVADQFSINEREIIAGGIERTIEDYLTIDGVRHDYLFTSFPIRDDQGIIRAVGGISVDITERKQAEEALRESEQRFREFFEHETNYCYQVSSDGIILDLNPSALRALGYPSKDDLVGKPLLTTIYAPASQDRARQLFRQWKETGELAEEEMTIVTRTGEERAIILNVSAVRDKEGRLLHSISIQTDVTERKQAEAEIRQLNASLERRVEERTRELRVAQAQLIQQEKLAILGRVAGSMGHELRNPLGVISNAVYFLKMVQSDASDKIKDYLNIIERETRISEKIVADLLDFVRIESAQRRSVSVSELIEKTLERFPAPVNVQVELDLPADLPNAYADSRHLIQVLGNLVLNAFQSMKDGGKLLVLSRVEGPALSPVEGTVKTDPLITAPLITDHWILITVRDTGIGIPPENLEKLFEPLFTTRTQGIGLGLPVSKKLIEANGGRIAVESDGVPGKGSTFTLYLPVYHEQ